MTAQRRKVHSLATLCHSLQFYVCLAVCFRLFESHEFFAQKFSLRRTHSAVATSISHCCILILTFWSVQHYLTSSKQATTMSGQDEKEVTAMDEVSVADPRAISRDLFSATLGSICCCYTGQPLDTVKVRMQTNPSVYHQGVWSSTLQIVQGEGLTALWKGAIPTAMGMAAENAVAFGVNEALKRAFPDDPLLKLDASQPPDLMKPFLHGNIDGVLFRHGASSK